MERPLRPRSYSCGDALPRASPSSLDRLVDSLDLSESIPSALRSLRDYLIGKVDEAELDVKALQAWVDESESEDDDDDELDDADGEVAPHDGQQVQAPLLSQQEQDEDDAQSALRRYVRAASRLLEVVRSDLRTLGSHASVVHDAELLHFSLSPDARASLDEFLAAHPLPSLRRLDDLVSDLRARLAAASASALAAKPSVFGRMASTDLASIQALLREWPQLSIPPSVKMDSTTITHYIPSMPSMPSIASLPSPPVAPLHTLRDYFQTESERLSSAIQAVKSEAGDSLSAGLAHLRDEANELIDEAARLYHRAVEGGRKRLLRYEELPHEWRNNENILTGYRFIEISNWRGILQSAFEWHNETINVQSHLLGGLSLVYLVVTLRDSVHLGPDRAWQDAAVAWLFILAAFKCLMCSVAWHLFAGCASHAWFRGAACVDFVGISVLIMASVNAMEYYGFYCRPGLAALYMSYSAVLGVSGMILPWQPWFNERRHKGTRIAFFLGLAISGACPLIHMGFLYGFSETFLFFSPVIPSVCSYLVGLFFYANSLPEKLQPGRWDNILASHQLWHFAIVGAVWLHWRAMNSWATEGPECLSCAPIEENRFLFQMDALATAVRSYIAS